MKEFLLTLGSIWVLISLSSCTVNIVQHAPSSNAEDRRWSEYVADSSSPLTSSSDTEFLGDIDSPESESDLLCEPFVFPDLSEVPQFPYVPPEKRGDDEYVSSLLIQHVNSLTQFIEQTDRLIREKYDEYIEQCR